MPSLNDNFFVSSLNENIIFYESVPSSFARCITFTTGAIASLLNGDSARSPFAGISCQTQPVRLHFMLSQTELNYQFTPRAIQARPGNEIELTGTHIQRGRVNMNRPNRGQVKTGCFQFEKEGRCNHQDYLSLKTK